MSENKIKYSPIFGDSIEVGEKEEENIQIMIDRHPIRVFQLLNIFLNDRGLCLYVDSLGDTNVQA